MGGVLVWCGGFRSGRIDHVRKTSIVSLRVALDHNLAAVLESENRERHRAIRRLQNLDPHHPAADKRAKRPVESAAVSGNRQWVPVPGGPFRFLEVGQVAEYADALAPGVEDLDALGLTLRDPVVIQLAAQEEGPGDEAVMGGIIL